MPMNCIRLEVKNVGIASTTHHYICFYKHMEYLTFQLYENVGNTSLQLYDKSKIIMPPNADIID